MTVALERNPPQIEDPLHDPNPRLGDEIDELDPSDQLVDNQVQAGDEGDEKEMLGGWLNLAKESYAFASSYRDTNHRKRWEDGIRAFNNQHAQDSKYLSSSYSKRSNLYRPKFRAISRKNEAAAASAFFSNSDILEVVARDQADPMARASADINKELVQYRLEESIHWFQACIGALQDCHKTGNVACRVYWEFEQNSKGDILKDCPVVQLIPIENLLFDPGSDWQDPVGTSPYIIHLMPMFVCDVMDKMKKPDPKTGRPAWKPHSESVLKRATTTLSDSTRVVREKNRTDPYDTENQPITDYSVVWIQRHIHRRDGTDWEFYTLHDQALLTDPQPLIKSTWTGERDYIVGTCNLETHTSMASSMAELGKPLFDEINEITNQRMDNVKLVLNKRWIVKRNRNVDVASLARNVPGSNTMADDPETDIREVNWPDVTASSFQEQDRLTQETDELMGNFNAANAPMRGRLSETVGGAQLMTSPASLITEYMLRTFVETWVMPVLKKLIKLEQKYETDEVLLALVKDKAKIYQRYGINQITDELLNQDLVVRVNVGMGATDPATKLQKFIMATNAYGTLVKAAIPGFNTFEAGKEIFGHAGYQDGRRFMTVDNPQVMQLQQQLMQAMQFIQKLGQELKNKTQDNQTKLEVAKINNEGKRDAAQISHPNSLDPMHEHVLKAHDIALRHEADMARLQAELRKFVIEQVAKIGLEREKMAIQREQIKNAGRGRPERKGGDTRKAN